MNQNSFELKGHEGELRWGYHQAAVLGAWTLTVTDAGVSLTARVVTTDALKVEQQPLTFRVNRQNGVAWTWPVDTLQLAGDSLTATLSPQE